LFKVFRVYVLESLFLIRGRKMSVFLGEEEKRAVKLDIPLTTGPRLLLPTPPRLSTKNQPLRKKKRRRREDHFLTIIIRPRRRRDENTKTH